jgi:hypothetical protein
VENNIEYPHKSYCRNKLAVFYSYDSKSLVHAKHIAIKIKLVLWKENIQDQIISVEKQEFANLLSKNMLPSVFKEPQSTCVYGKVYYLWILKAQNKIRIHFRMEICMVVVKSCIT